MDHAAAKDWLDRYISAWLSYDQAAIGDLFSEDVLYCYHPDKKPTLGRAAVVASWLGESASDDVSTRDAPDTYAAAYEPIAIDGDVVVATGTSTYFTGPGGPVERVYDNCFVMHFDTAGAVPGVH